MFTGRPTPPPGEPLFTEEDTAGAIALAEEERDTCSSCGYPKAWCRAPEHQFSFEPHEETCHVTYRLASYRESTKWTAKHDATKQATQVSGRFREGVEPDFEAGLGLPDDQQQDDGE